MDRYGNPVCAGYPFIVSDGTTTLTAVWNPATSSYVATFSELSPGTVSLEALIDGGPTLNSATTTIT